LAESENAERKLHLATEWRGRRGTQNHHDVVTYLLDFCRLDFWESDIAARKRAADIRVRFGSAGDDEIDGFWTLALFVRLDVERDTLAFVERLHASTLDCGDVHEHVASAVVGLDEAVASLGIEELDGTTLRHREAPIPNCPAAGPHGATARPDIHT